MALEYADAMTITGRDVSDELFARLRRHYSDDALVELTAVMVVDGDTVLATPAQLVNASVSARVVEETKGRKIEAFTYKSKANERKRWGHRQTYATIEITGITAG